MNPNSSSKVCPKGVAELGHVVYDTTRQVALVVPPRLGKHDGVVRNRNSKPEEFEQSHSFDLDGEAKFPCVHTKSAPSRRRQDRD